MNSAPLPRDTTTLQAMVVAQQAEIEHLKLIIAKLRRMRFGQSCQSASNSFQVSASKFFQLLRLI